MFLQEKPWLRDIAANKKARTELLGDNSDSDDSYDSDDSDAARRQQRKRFE